MSDLLNQASLVMVPSGYKEDTVYSVVPSDGSGDLSFTRASNGTRINSSGLVEVVPWNFIQYSEDFSNAAYTNIRINVTTNAVANPINGTVNADKLIADTNNGLHALRQTVLFQTVFIYAKKGESDQIAIRDDGNTGKYASFNLTSGTIIDFSNSGGTQSITSIGNGWYLCQINFATQGEYLLGVYCLSNSYTSGSPTVAYTGNGTDGLFVWGYQANIGSTAKPYFPTTDRLNVPRLTYQNGGGGCPSLLLEKQSTNLVSYSNGFDDAYWNKTSQGVGSNAVITPNYTTSPDGTNNAFRFQCNLNGGTTTNDRSWMLASFTAQATSTISIYIKLNSAGTKTFIFSDSGGNTKTISNTEWQRIDTTFSGAGGEFRIGLIGGLGTSDTLDCSIAFAQAESGSYATSYIPTTSSSATRVADLAYKSSISSLFGASATSFFMDFEITQASSGGNWTVTGYDGSNLFSLCQFDTASNYPRIVFDGGVDTTLGTALSIGRHKIAVSFATNDFRAYIDGALVLTDTSCTYNRYDRIAVNGTAWIGNTYNTNSFKLNQYAQFPNTLTNAELASLTTL